MMQQSARFLQKLYKKVKAGEKVSGIYDYINELENVLNNVNQYTSKVNFENSTQIELALKIMSLHTIDSTIKKMKESNISKQDLTNKVFGLDLVEMATVHIKFMMFKIFRKKLMDLQCSKLREHMLNMCCLLGLTYINQHSSAGYESGLLQKGTMDKVNT